MWSVIDFLHGEKAKSLRKERERLEGKMWEKKKLLEGNLIYNSIYSIHKT